VSPRSVPLFLLAALALAGCVSVQTAAPPTAPFLTATLPPSPLPPPTETPPPPTSVPTLPPIDGSTTTQLNVRTEPSTGGATVGMLAPFTAVQVIARDAGGNWYQIVHPAAPEGKGWVRAEYVQVPDPSLVPPLSGAPGAQEGPSGTVSQQINVRSGPGTTFDSLGTLNPQDSVTLTARNPEGSWLQIAFSAGPEGRGWVAAGFIEGADASTLPIIGEQGAVVGTGTAEAPAPTSTPTVLAAYDDGDSASGPAVNVVFSPSGAGGLQYISEVSAPQGDAADWVQFTPYMPAVTIELTCLGSNGASAELLEAGAPVPGTPRLACGGKQLLELTPGTAYLVRVDAPASAQALESTRFTLILTTLR